MRFIGADIGEEILEMDLTDAIRIITENTVDAHCAHPLDVFDLVNSVDKDFQASTMGFLHQSRLYQ